MKLDFVRELGGRRRAGAGCRQGARDRPCEAPGTEMVVTFALGYIAKADEDSNKAVKRKWIRANVYFRPPVQRGGIEVGG